MNPDGLEQFVRFIPFLIPILLVQLGLVIWAVIDLIKQPATRGPKWLWALVIVFVNIFGPIAYFIFGRKEE